MQPAEFVIEPELEAEKIGTASAAAAEVFGAVVPAPRIERCHGDDQSLDRGFEPGEDLGRLEGRIQVQGRIHGRLTTRPLTASL